jgi:hypothetical protein
MNLPDDVELIVGLGVDKDDKLVLATYLEMDDLEDFLEDCLEIVREKRYQKALHCSNLWYNICVTFT